MVKLSQKICFWQAVLPNRPSQNNFRNLCLFVAKNRFTFLWCQNPPLSRGQIAQPEISDADTNQTQRRMANGGSHSPDLTVFAFNQFQGYPAIRHIFAETDGWIARRQGRARHLRVRREE
jgi:hypothetical protein